MDAAWLPAYVAIGSNLDHPRRQVELAFARLATLRETRCVARSRLYSTAPLGPQDQPDFVNAAAGLLTHLSAAELLAELLETERSMGRNRAERWGPRVIDLDLIWMPGAPLEQPGLTLPHPGVSERNFVLYPLHDIAPTLRIAGKGQVDEMMSRVGGHGISVIQEEAAS